MRLTAGLAHRSDSRLRRYVLAPSVDVIGNSVGPSVLPQVMLNHVGYPTDTVNTTSKEACQQRCVRA